MENRVHPDQLARQKPADLDLLCFQTKIRVKFQVRYPLGKEVALFNDTFTWVKEFSGLFLNSVF